MIQSFRDQRSRDVFDGKDTKAARTVCPQQLWSVAQRRLTTLHTANDLRDLRTPGNGLEALKKNRAGEWAIRINDQYRICFAWEGSIATDVEITDYH